jgi:phosphatidylglycerol---prolipoprotein diacylglyceryl transferase
MRIVSAVSPTVREGPHPPACPLTEEAAAECKWQKQLSRVTILAHLRFSLFPRYSPAAMWPTLLKIGSFEITTFGLMMFLSFAVAAYLLSREFRRRGLDPEVASSMVLAAAIGGILGGKIYYSILYKDPALLLSRSGLVWYGGLIGGWLAGSWIVMRNKVPYLLGADATAAPLSMGYCLGRIGCFLVGDDYGRPTDSWVGIAFPKGAPPTTAESLREFGVKLDPSIPSDAILKVHPTQLYEAGAALLMFFIIAYVSKRPHRLGLPFGLFFLFLGIERFLVEFVRAKDDRFFGPFTVAQLISILCIAAGTYLIVTSRRRREVVPVPLAESRAA